MKDLKFISPFKKLCITIGNLPTAYIESMSYYEGLTFLVNYLANNVIPAVNNNSEVVKELQDQFVILKNYVDNYFDNLDVQEEINNKLDEMADSGQLTDIIAQYLGLAGMITFDTVADMKLAENLVNGSKCSTLGFYNVNDGGNAFYKIREVINTDTIDEMTLFALHDPTLVAELIIELPIDPLKLGAKGNGTDDDYNYLAKSLSYKNVILTKGSYLISSTLNIESDTILDGKECTIIPDENITAITIQGNGISNPVVNTNIKNIKIDTSNSNTNGIYLKDGYFNYFDNINISQLSSNDSYGIKIINGFNHKITNSRVLGNRTYTGQKGIDISSTNTNDSIENMTNCKYDTLLLQRLEYGVKCNYLTTANTVEFNNIGFSDCDYAYYLTGNAEPIAINNTRIEDNQNLTSYGYYIDSNIYVSINNFNIYNVKYPIYNNSTNDVYASGMLSCTGTTKSPKFTILTTNGNFITDGQWHINSNTYNFCNSSSIATDKYIANGSGFINIGNTVTGDSFDIPSPHNRIVKLENRLFNVYGTRGCEMLVYATTTGYVLQSSTNGSPTSAFSGSNITVEPYKFYKIKMIDNNKWTVID